MASIPPYMFDADDADFILRSSPPQLDFRVHRAIIALASPPLATMLALPQPSLDEPSDSRAHQIPVVDVSESASTLRTLLQLIYPIADTPTANNFLTIDDLVSVFEAAFKYDVDGAIVRLRMILVSPKWLESSPLRVYAVAMRWDLEEEAKIASRYTLRECLFDSPLLADFRHTSGYAFQRLVSLHRTRANAAVALLEGAAASSRPCNYCSHVGVQWFAEWKHKAKEELSLRPTTEVAFSLPFLGAIWAATLTPPGSCSNSNCEKFKMWTQPVGAALETLKAKIDALPATI